MIYHVSANAPREGNGTKERPFRRISDAANIALPGDEVLVYPGVYREQVSPRNGGTEENRITYRPVEPLGALITGAEEVSGWVPNPVESREAPPTSSFPGLSEPPREAP